MTEPRPPTPDDAVARMDAAVIHAAVTLREVADDPEADEGALRAGLRHAAELVDEQQSRWMQLYGQWRRTHRQVRILTVATATFVLVQIVLFGHAQEWW